MSVVTVNKDNFQKEVLEYKGVVFADFYADWCAPCKLTSPLVDELAKEYGEVKFVKIDVDANPDLSAEYSVFSIPTFMLIKDGKIVSQLVGARGKENFVEEIKKATS